MIDETSFPSHLTEAIMKSTKQIHLQNDLVRFSFDAKTGSLGHNNRPQTVRLILDPAALGYAKPRPGTLHRSDGPRARAGRARRDGRICLEAKLRPLEVAVWAIPAKPGRS